jgi:AraC-like DNA-binding protein
MLVAALVPTPLLLRLIDSVSTRDRAPQCELVLATGWNHLTELLRARPVSLAFIDPTVNNVFEASELMRVLRRFPSTPMIAYTSITPTTMRAMPILMRRGLRDLVLHPDDDHRRRILRIMAGSAIPNLVVQLQTALSAQLASLPPIIASVIRYALEHPQAYPSVSVLIQATGYPKSTFHAFLRNSGIGSPKRLCIVARLAHAVTYLRDSGASVTDVATKLGYPYVHHLVRHTQQALGVQPHRLRPQYQEGALTDAEIVTRLLAWVAAS